MRQVTVKVKATNPNKTYNVPVTLPETLKECTDRFTSEAIVELVCMYILKESKRTVRKDHAEDYCPFCRKRKPCRCAEVDNATR